MKKELKDTRGITLIALVITIIVLLILAGVSIAMLTGDNGIITQANNAKVANEKATAKEKVQVEVGGSRGTDGKLDYSLLKDNLNNIKDIEGVPSTITEESFPLEVTVDGYKVTITDNGTVAVEGESVEDDDSSNMDAIANDIKNNYSTYLAKAQGLGQNTKQDIGIGTDGNVVNLELWGYFKTDDGEGISLGEGIGSMSTGGYVGKIVNGEIIGKVPQYIYIKEEEKAYPITSLIGTFSWCDGAYMDLYKAPEIPETVTVLEGTFKWCHIGEVRIPNSVTSIGEYTFADCDSLTSIEIPSVTSIGSNAFEYCDNLTSIEIPSVTSIGSNAFEYCDNLTSIYLGKKLENIEYNAFVGCDKLTNVYYEGTEEDWGKINIEIGGSQSDGNSVLINANITYNYKK